MGRRFWAIVLDGVVLGILYSVMASAFGTHQLQHTITTTTNQAGHVIMANKGVSYSSNLSGLPEILYDFAVLLYFVLLEGLVGATVGKLALGLRVRTEDGRPINLQQSLIRNLMRVVDTFPYVIPYLLGYIVAMNNDKRQRLGDKVAHTLVGKPTPVPHNT